jgi:PHD-like zinc-binding domain
MLCHVATYSCQSRPLHSLLPSNLLPKLPAITQYHSRRVSVSLTSLFLLIHTHTHTHTHRGARTICALCQLRGATVKCNYALCRRVFHLRCAIAVHCTLLEARPSTEKGAMIKQKSSLHRMITGTYCSHLYKMKRLMIRSSQLVSSYVISFLLSSHALHTSDDSPHEICTIIACPEHFRKIDTVRECLSD